ncbi:hypothetical protein M0804_015564, partial [Polistes exclamans]
MTGITIRPGETLPRA